MVILAVLSWLLGHHANPALDVFALAARTVLWCGLAYGVGRIAYAIAYPSELFPIVPEPFDIYDRSGDETSHAEWRYKRNCALDEDKRLRDKTSVQFLFALAVWTPLIVWLWTNRPWANS